MKKFLLLLTLLIFPLVTFAWDQTGHKLIALIAYDNLNNNTKIAINAILDSKKTNDTSNYRILAAAVWPDQIRGDNVTAFDSWHFIDQPFSRDNTPLPPVATQNVVWAILQAEQVLNSNTAPPAMKNLFLKFLIHFVGDIHQPLHSATLVSKALPNGDEGGNLFPIQSPVSNDLHGLWDQGVGYFAAGATNYPLHYWQLRKMATAIETQYPASYFGAKATDLNPKLWAQESFKLAVNSAYKNIQPNSVPSDAYIQHNQIVVQQQIALAGYRLANVLNQIFAQSAD